jgi:hypothetical protein
VSEQGPKCSGLAVPVCADHDKSGFGEALGLEPGFGAARAIRRDCLFGNDALKAPVSTCLKERGTVAYPFFAELNAAFFIVSDQNF